MNFSNKLKLCALKPALRVAQNVSTNFENPKYELQSETNTTNRIYNRTRLIRLENDSRNDFGILDADSAKTRTFKTSGLSFILDLYGKEHPYYEEFESVLSRYKYESYIKGGIEIICTLFHYDAFLYIAISRLDII